MRKFWRRFRIWAIRTLIAILDFDLRRAKKIVRDDLSITLLKLTRGQEEAKTNGYRYGRPRGSRYRRRSGR
jgi:hypothetical protein